MNGSFEYGDCAYVAYKITQALLSNGIKQFVVIEGMVDDGARAAIPHTWIRMGKQDIDPTFEKLFSRRAVKLDKDSGEMHEEYKPQDFLRHAKSSLGLDN